MSEQRDKNRKDKNCREREREEKHKEKCEEPKKREKCKEVVKCPSFPICITTENKANVRVFGTPTSLTVPLNLNFLGLGTGALAGIPYGITVTGTCASPTIVLTIGTVSIAVTPGTPCTAAVTPPVTTGINSSITVSGVPLIGYNGDPLSTTVLVSNLQIISRCAGTVVVQGTLNQTLALNGVAGPLPPDVLSTSATSLAAAIINAITALVTCAGSTLATLLPAGVITIITTFLPSITGTSTISDLIAAITPFILPGLSATLTSLFATASANVPVTLPVTDIPFTATLSDCALEGLGRKEKLCVKGTAILDSIAPFALPLSATDLATPVTITGTSTCISVAFASEPLTIGTYLASIGITGSVIPAINCIMLTPGGSCTVFSPALTIIDDVTICLNHGNACLCGPNNIAPRTIPGVATGFSGNCRTC